MESDDGIELPQVFEKVEINEEEERQNSKYNQPATAATVELDDRLTKASKEDIGAWVAAYQKLMAKSIKQFHVLLLTTSWAIVEPVKNVMLYQRYAEKNYYTFKVTAVLNVRPERLAYVINDHNESTRMPWDEKNIKSCREWESYDCGGQGKIRFVSCEVYMKMHLVWNRSLQGIMWSSFDAATRSYTIIFRSTQHRLHRCPDKTVAVNALIGVVIRMTDKKNVCEVTIITHINPGDSLPSVLVDGYKEWLRERVDLYERVTKEWDTYYGARNDPKKHRI